MWRGFIRGSSVVNEPRRLKPRPTVGVVELSNVSTFSVSLLASLFIAVRLREAKRRRAFQKRF